MATLDAAQRDRLPKSDFGLPGQDKYPMPDASHAANAKARAKQQLEKGHITTSEYHQIVAKADKILGEKHSSGSKALSK
jgi:hypothetical protein